MPSKPPAPVAASSDASHSALDEALQCPICMEPYDLVLRVPQLLHSSHTVCSPCIDDLVLHASSTRIQCPQCQTQVDSTQRTSNTVVCHVVEALQQSRQHRQQQEQERKDRGEGANPLSSTSPTAAVPAAPSAASDDGEELEEEEKDDGAASSAAGASSPNERGRRRRKKRNARAKQPSSAAAGVAPSSSTLPPAVAPAAAPSPSPVASAPLPRESRLTDARLFPVFAALPEPWEERSCVYVVKEGRRWPKYTWTFMGEIKWLQVAKNVNMQVLDKAWQQTLLMVPLTWQEVDTSYFQKGWTVFVRYAEARRKGGRLQDQMDAIFADDARMVTTIKASLADVLDYDRCMAERDAMSIEEVAALRCSECHERLATKRCAGCGVRDYCSRECQVRQWEEHRDGCRIWAALREVHSEVKEELQGEAPRSYSLRELSSAPPSSRMRTEWTPFKHNPWIREL